MTASSAEITPGSGLKLATNSYTESAVTVHSQNMIAGEQYLPSYLCATRNTGAAISCATLDSHLYEIVAGASLRLRVRRIEINQIAVATTAALASIQIVRITTAGTGGSAAGGVAVNPSDSAAGLTGMTLPTVKGTEAASVIWSGAAYFMQTIAASAQLSQPILVVDFDRPRSQPLIISAGTTNGIAIKLHTAVAAATVDINVWVDESTF